MPGVRPGGGGDATRRRRTLIAIPFVLAWAAYGYLHDTYQTFDLAVQTYPFDVDHGTDADLPATIRAMDGRRVIVSGEMLPIDQGADGIRQFAIMQPMSAGQECPDPADGRRVAVDAPLGQPYLPGTFRAYGRLRVGVVRDDGDFVAAYKLVVDRIETPDPGPASWWPGIGVSGVIAGGGCAWALARARQCVRRSAGRCVGCGYDLRATPGRCPECGRTAVTPGAVT